MPTITQLEYIVTVDKMRHFGKAAKACHVSQPSLSMQIKKVEDEVEFPIFDRIKKPIVPTEKGALFIESAKAVLREHSRMMALAKKKESEVSGEFRLGIIPTVAPYLLPLFLDDFSKRYPAVRLRVDEMKTDNIIHELQRDMLDAGILATPLNEGGLTEKPLYYEKFSLYVAREHILSRKKFLRERDLDGAEMWLLQDGHCLRNQMVRLCSLRQQKGVFKNVQFEGGNLETLRYLVRKGHGYTLIPSLFVNTLSAEERRQYVRDFEVPVPTREVGLVFRRDQWKSDIIQAIAETVRDSLPKEIMTEKDVRLSHVIKVT